VSTRQVGLSNHVLDRVLYNSLRYLLSLLFIATLRVAHIPHLATMSDDGEDEVIDVAAQHKARLEMMRKMAEEEEKESRTNCFINSAKPE